VTPPRVGFIGTFGHQPNLDGARWFIENVWPDILQTMPHARLRLVGDRSTDASLDGLSKRVIWG
jgi:hypothetical protein